MHVYHSRSAKYCVLGNWEAVTVNVSCQSCCCCFLSAALSDPFKNVTISVPEKTAGRRFIQPPVDFNQRQCLPERVGGENEVDSLHTALYHVTPCMRGVGGMSDCFNFFTALSLESTHIFMYDEVSIFNNFGGFSCQKFYPIMRHAIVGAKRTWRKGYSIGLLCWMSSV